MVFFFFKEEWIDWPASHKAGGTDRIPKNRTVLPAEAGQLQVYAICSLHLLSNSMGQFKIGRQISTVTDSECFLMDSPPVHVGWVSE